MNCNASGFRHEYKYLISKIESLRLREILSKFLKSDPNSKGERGYHVRSLYFDDMYDTALRDKYLGTSCRRKFRIRIYDFSSNTIKLEQKIKRGEYIQKKSCTISPGEFLRIFKGEAAWLAGSNHRVKKDYYIQMRINMLRPKVIVDYEREAYIMPFNQIRITFDKNLSAARPSKELFKKNLCSFSAGDSDSVILEIKYNNFLPVHIKRLLEGHCLSRLAVSKYVICRERLNNF